MIKIISATEETLPKAKKLIKRVFPSRTLFEQLSLIAMTNQDNWLINKLTNLFGYNIIDIWVAVNEKEEVVGTTGLYSCRQDEDVALWLFWYCVDPEERGKRIGKKLLTYAIEQAKSRGAKYLRLYTSDDPNERAAQIVYEKHGLNEIKRKNKLFYTEIIRELKFYG
ncbi:GNAT family N-acetyltransferase [Natranaerobius thermophilus]|uniref:GCN5-related N-acetyltransferase n=1 Tax=Natranaerobius thermophilus (strain ATCC BAA-1301 / DSM 18059 / JW/NM-WN-LF) TaxID=457570 RepID=B2A425_NATTJ|nr:GNAT family N-acetyltransferase [Natranaerobius thermophilus]ACB85127.1 GCN5-related N-acetyltransferase [Natranaerobius thermophilus JW/NM-WN-LF]